MAPDEVAVLDIVPDGDEGRTSRVRLRVEQLDSKHTKGILLLHAFGSVIALAVAIATVVLLHQRTQASWLADRHLDDVNLVFGTLCTAALLAALLVFSHRVLDVIRHDLTWPPRGRRYAALTAAFAVSQLASAVCLMAGNAYLLARPCGWFGGHQSAFAFLRYTSFNTDLLLLHMLCKSMQPWTDRKGELKASKTNPYPLVLDAPLSSHWVAFGLWATIEALRLVPLVASYATGTGLPRQPLPAPACDAATWVCRSEPWKRIVDAIAVALSMAWFLLYLLNLRRGFKMLLRQSYTGYLDANISIRLQARGIIMPYFVVFLTLALTGFAKRGNCLYYITDAYGNSALVIAFTTVAVVNVLLYMPVQACDDATLQAELRDFAWTEGGLPGKRAQLAKSAHGSDNEQTTVFCFQTAVQAILWSKVAYTFLGENALALEDDKLAATLNEEGWKAPDADDSVPADGNADADAKSTRYLPAIDPVAEMTMAMRMYDLEHLQHFREPVRDSRVALAWNRTTIMLAFRGTASLKNAQTDIKVLLEDHPLLAGTSWWRRCRVHHGFLRCWTSSGMDERIVASLRELLDSGQVDRHAATVYVTGHSLGGALAILGALAIACDTSMALRKDQVVCYAVAAPRVGNRNFAAAYELLVPNTWNVINDQDAVPRHGKLMVYKRCGQRAIMNYRGELLVRPGPVEQHVQLRLCGSSVTDHWLKSYMDAAIAIVQAQFTAKRFESGTQGALELLAIQDVRLLLEEGGLDWKSLRAVATGNVEAGTELSIGKKKHVTAKVAQPVLEQRSSSGLQGFLREGGFVLLQDGLLTPLKDAVGIVHDSGRAAADMAGLHRSQNEDERLQTEITLDAVGMDAIRRAPAASATKRRSASLRKATSLASTPEQEPSQGTARISAASSGAIQPSAQQEHTTQQSAVQVQSIESTLQPNATSQSARSGREMRATQELDFTVLEPITIASPTVATTMVGCGGCFPK